MEEGSEDEVPDVSSVLAGSGSPERGEAHWGAPVLLVRSGLHHERQQVSPGFLTHGLVALAQVSQGFRVGRSLLVVLVVGSQVVEGPLPFGPPYRWLHGGAHRRERRGQSHCQHQEPPSGLSAHGLPPSVARTLRRHVGTGRNNALDPSRAAW